MEPLSKPIDFTSPSNVQHQAEVLHKALAGLGTKEKDIIDVLAKQSADRRQAISDAYKAAYRKELLDDLKGETSGDFRKILKALCRLPEVNDAKTLHYAVKGLGTDEDTILEVLCTRTNGELNKISNLYFSLFRTTLISDLKKDTSGDFLEVLLNLVSGLRDESGKVDAAQAKKDAEAMLKAGPKHWGTDVETFTDIFATRNFAQLRETFREYERIAGTDVQKSIKSEMSVNLIQNKEEYFAERLQQAVKGTGTNDDKLIRIFVSRMDKDLKGIDKAFQKLYGKNLVALINEETSSDYKNTLLTILENAV